MNLQVVNFERCKHVSGSSKEPGPVPSMSGMSEIAACPRSPIADHPKALPSPASSPSSSQYLFLPVPSMPLLCASCCTTELFKVVYYKIKNVLFCVFFTYYLYEKYHKPISVQYYMGCPCGSDGKESVCNVGDLGFIPGWEGPLEKGTVTHSCILASRIPQTEESGGLQSMASQRVGHGWEAFTSPYYIADYCSGVPRLTLLDLWTNWA